MTSNHLKAWMKQALEPEEGKQPQRQPCNSSQLLQERHCLSASLTFVRLLIQWTMRKASPSWKTEEHDLTCSGYSTGFGDNKRLHADRVASMALHFEQEEAPLKVDSSPPLSSTSSWTKW